MQLTLLWALPTPQHDFDCWIGSRNIFHQVIHEDCHVKHDEDLSRDAQVKRSKSVKCNSFSLSIHVCLSQKRGCYWTQKGVRYLYYRHIFQSYHYTRLIWHLWLKCSTMNTYSGGLLCLTYHCCFKCLNPNHKLYSEVFLVVHEPKSMLREPKKFTHATSKIKNISSCIFDNKTNASSHMCSPPPLTKEKRKK